MIGAVNDAGSDGIRGMSALQLSYNSDGICRRVADIVMIARFRDVWTRRMHP